MPKYAMTVRFQTDDDDSVKDVDSIAEEVKALFPEAARPFVHISSVEDIQVSWTRTAPRKKKKKGTA